MVINIGMLPENEYIPLSFTEDVSIPPEYGLLDRNTAVAVEAALYNNGGGAYTLRGRGEALITMSCAKCLRPVERRVSFDIAERYSEGASDGEEDIWSYTGREIDLSPALRNGLLLDIPIRAVCSDSCRGLCPICGIDLNAGGCECDARPTDSRFDVLRSFFDGQDE